MFGKHEINHRGADEIPDLLERKMLTMEQEGRLDYCAGRSWPVRIHYYKNPWHSRNCYIELELERYDIELAQETFAPLRRCITAPLQIMLRSDECEKINFIVAAGFELKRRCFELAVSRQDLIEPLQGKKLPIQDQSLANLQGLHHQADGEPLAMAQLAGGLYLISPTAPQYNEAVGILYQHYRSTHEHINPLTAEQAAFSSELPNHVIIDLVKGSIRHLAFIEENEIAYVASTGPEEFSCFADKLLLTMFASYEEIRFEADDLDPVATALRMKFRSDGKASHDTYIHSNQPGCE